jgi:hypothetical protein
LFTKTTRAFAVSVTLWRSLPRMPMATVEEIGYIHRDDPNSRRCSREIVLHWYNLLRRNFSPKNGHWSITLVCPILNRVDAVPSNQGSFANSRVKITTTCLETTGFPFVQSMRPNLTVSIPYDRSSIKVTRFTGRLCQNDRVYQELVP